MKKVYIIISIVALLIIAGYLYLRFGILKTKDFKPDALKASSVLDLRPAIIAKLQQLVKDGSGGLYNLSIDKLEPNISEATLDIENATLVPDSAAIVNLDANHKVPDDIFKITFDSLHIDGIGIPDLLNKDQVDLKVIRLIDPVINVYHSKRPYNKDKAEANDSLSLYKLLMKNMKRIKIDSVTIENGTFINHNLDKNNKLTTIERIGARINDILVDSSTQNDRERFLFAKSAYISLKDYSVATPDSLYYFKASLIELSPVKRRINAFNIELVPRGNKMQFEKKLDHTKDMFDIKTKKIALNEVNFYEFLNDEKLIINNGSIEDCNFYDYFDRSIPSATSKATYDNFPHQLLMRMALPVYIQKLNLKNLDVEYEEFNPKVHKSGIVYFTDINGTVSNITNMREYIRKDSKMKFSAIALFMKKVNFETTFLLDLKNYKNGHFSIDVTAGKIGNDLINPVAEPLGLVSMNRGTVNKVVAHLDGNNYKGTGKLLLLYDDLHINPLKTDDEGKLKKRNITGFLANLILIKKANPSGNNKPRTETCDFTREPHSSFFNLIWKTMLTGALKTVGLPEKLAHK